MREPDIVLRAGDRLPVVSRTITVEGVAVNLTGYTVTMVVTAIGGGTNLLTTPTATIDPDQVTNPGVVTYQFTTNDATVLVAGMYAAWFDAVNSSRTLSAPNDGFLILQSVADGSAVWSYTGDPSSRALDKVRYLIGDTDPAKPKFLDKELLFLLSEWNGNAYMAAAAGCEDLASSSIKDGVQSKSVGDLSLSYGFQQQAAEYRMRAERLRAMAAANRVWSPVVGGVSADRLFAIGMHDSPGVSYPVGSRTPTEGLN